MILYPILPISPRGWMAGLKEFCMDNSKKQNMDPQIKEEKRRVMALNNAFIF